MFWVNQCRRVLKWNVVQKVLTCNGRKSKFCTILPLLVQISIVYNNAFRLKLTQGPSSSSVCLDLHISPSVFTRNNLDIVAVLTGCHLSVFICLTRSSHLAIHKQRNNSRQSFPNKQNGESGK